MALQQRKVNQTAKVVSRAAPVAEVGKDEDVQHVTLVHLLRGRVYFYKNVQFEKGTPVVLEDQKLPAGYTVEKFAEELGELYDEVTDSDNDVFSKALFDVEYDQPRPQKKSTSERRFVGGKHNNVDGTRSRR